MANNEPTTRDILDAINDFSTNVDKRMDNMDKRIDNVDKRMDNMEADIKSIKSTMVTKDYLDEKLSDLRGDLTILIRKEDTKVKALVDLLVKRKVLTKKDSQQIFALEPFAQILL